MRRVAILIIIALAVTMPVHAKAKKDKKHATQRVSKEQRAIKTFSPAERNLIRAELLGKKRKTSQKSHKNLPPGLQKKVARGKALPPGWQKKIAAGQSLDYQLYRQSKGLPELLLQRLPQPPAGSEILRVEDKIIRINEATRTILDVFDLIPTR